MEEDIKILEDFLDLERTEDYKGDLTGFCDEFVLEVEEKDYKALENLLTRYKQQQKLINKLAEHIAISGLERSWTKTFEEDVEDIKKMFINEVEEEGD